MNKQQFRISPERAKIVLRDISDGSEPAMRFYIMVALSTMIASFGLITNSTAVIIGAMLVAPLMTPIFGIALGLVRSDAHLFGTALRAEIAGVVAAILMGVILGLGYPALEPTPEMIARTKPNLFDLLVAVFSGLAGAYALMDEKISPALPGVAIATAIVPPLANAGLCFALGEYVAGVGSFLLFFANFLSILLIASSAFWFFGMTGMFTSQDKKTLIKRFSLPTVCFVLVAVFLTNTLLSIARESFIRETIQATLESDLLTIQDTILESAKHDEEDGTIYVMAVVQSSGSISPIQVAQLENNLEDALDQKTSLIVRSKLAKEVSAIGSEIQLGKQRLDGSFINDEIPLHVREAKIADTTIRNFLAPMAGFSLDRVRTFTLRENSIFIAYIHGIVPPSPESIQKIEELLRRELKRSDIHLVFNFTENRLYDSSGLVRFEFSGLSLGEDAERPEVLETVSFLEDELSAMPDVIVSGINYDIVKGVLYIMIDAYGTVLLEPGTVDELQKRAVVKADMAVELFIYMQDKTVVTSSGYEPFPAVSSEGFTRQLPSIKEDVKEIIRKLN